MCKFKVYNKSTHIDLMFMYCNMTAVVALFPLSHHMIINYFFVIGMIKIWSLNKFDFNTVLSILTILCVRSSRLIYLWLEFVL